MQSFIHTDSPDGEPDIATLVRRALAEVCTVPVLLVMCIRRIADYEQGRMCMKC